jgi:hypothetical protein
MPPPIWSELYLHSGPRTSSWASIRSGARSPGLASVPPRSHPATLFPVVWPRPPNESHEPAAIGVPYGACKAPRPLISSFVRRSENCGPASNRALGN